VALPGVRLAGGRASGSVHLADDPLDWRGAGPLPTVLSVASLWWPPHGVELEGVAGFVVQGVPDARESPSDPRPAVAGLDRDLFREGEIVELDGDRAEVTIEGVREIRVVTAFLQRRDGRILLLKRSEKVGSFQGCWAAVSGFLEAPTPLEQAYREIREEVSLERAELSLRSEGAPVLARSGSAVYIVHPFRFETRRSRIRLDWEHTEAEWVRAEELARRETVPKLDRAWGSVAPPPKS
jgi:8-oxo-dGTP diphosphatase